MLERFGVLLRKMAATRAQTQVNGLSETNGSPRKRLRRTEGSNNKVTVILGAQWGDEGKGKVVDLLATDMDVVCRCQVRK